MIDDGRTGVAATLDGDRAPAPPGDSHSRGLGWLLVALCIAFPVALSVALSFTPGCRHPERAAPAEDPLQACCVACLKATRLDPRAAPLDDVPCFGIAEGGDVISPRCRDILRGAGATPASCRGEPSVPPPPSL